MSSNCFAVNGPLRNHQLMYRMHSCNCTECFGGNLGSCKNKCFFPEWQISTPVITPAKPPTTHQQHAVRIRKQLVFYTQKLQKPFFCLAHEAGCQWPLVLLVQPKTIVRQLRVHCHILPREGAAVNNFFHTQVRKPHSFCHHLSSSCPKNTCNHLHLTSFPIKDILAILLYKSPTKANEYISAMTQKGQELYSMNETKQSFVLLNHYTELRKSFNDDFFRFGTQNQAHKVEVDLL